MTDAPTGPAGIADCHVHVIAPPEQFPLFAGRSGTPAPASLEGWRATLEPLGVTRGVVVQPSFYGTDNRVMLAALQQGGGRLVGVAAVGADVSDARRRSAEDLPCKSTVFRIGGVPRTRCRATCRRWASPAGRR